VADANPGLTVDHEYIITDARKGTEPVYDPEFTMMFPRMYSSQANHVDAVQAMEQFQGPPMRTTDREGKPTIIYKPTFRGEPALLRQLPGELDVLALLPLEFRRPAERYPRPRQHHSTATGTRASSDRCATPGQPGQPAAEHDGNKGMNKLFLLPLILGADRADLPTDAATCATGAW
jgi:hypothetical protein